MPSGGSQLTEEADLDFSHFHCCGDEDLYPFGCPVCGHCMVFCYECDVLYGDLTDLANLQFDVNHSNGDKPIFDCPKCSYEFEYFFMKNPKYLVPLEDWISRGNSQLLLASVRRTRST